MNFPEYDEEGIFLQDTEQSLYQQVPEESSSDIQLILAHLGLLETPELTGASIEQLINELQDARWETRASAATALGDLKNSCPH